MYPQRPIALATPPRSLEYPYPPCIPTLSSSTPSPSYHITNYPHYPYYHHPAPPSHPQSFNLLIPYPMLTPLLLGPCKVIAPQLEKMSEEFKDVDFYKLDVDENAAVAGELAVRAMPTFMFFKDGQKLDEVIGANIKAVRVSHTPCFFLLFIFAWGRNILCLPALAPLVLCANEARSSASSGDSEIGNAFKVAWWPWKPGKRGRQDLQENG